MSSFAARPVRRSSNYRSVNKRRYQPPASSGDPGEELDSGKRLGVTSEDVGGGEAKVVPGAKLVEKLGPGGGGIDADHRRLLDLVVVAPDRLAVRAQDVELVPGLVAAAVDVAGVGVLGHEAQRLALSAAADEEERMWSSSAAPAELSVRPSR